MDRYDNFLSVSLPKYINNVLIDEIIISDENGNDTKKIKKYIKNLDKVRFNINSKRLGAFYNKIKCCLFAKNDWIALIDSDNFADINYFQAANVFFNNNIKPNSILAPCYAKPNFDYRHLEGVCFKKGNLKNIPNCKHTLLMNTGNYIINKYLINNLKIEEKNEKITKTPADVLLFNTILFEQLDLEMYIVPNLYYNHIVHDGSFYKNESKKYKNEINIIHQRYYKLFNAN
jgi:hypothetical protein